MDEQLRHTPEETEAGRAGIEALRAQLGRRRAERSEATTVAIPDSVERETVTPPSLEAEIAWGADRERLEAQIIELEAEVTRRRQGLGGVLRAAAGAISTEDVDS